MDVATLSMDNYEAMQASGQAGLKEKVLFEHGY